MSQPQPDWPRVTELFHQALERQADERESFIDAIAAADDQLACEVRTLLAAHESAGQFLEDPAELPDALVGPAADGIGQDARSGDAPAEDAMWPPGARLGSYLIRREIGRGGMGVVYLADDLRLGRSVALKALPRTATSDPLRRERLRREALAAAALSHPSIVTVYALEEIDGGLFIASEYVPGRTLRSRLAAGPVSPDDAVSIAVAVAGALDAAHRAGVVHRDLKPDNILMGADGRVRVVDFGIASLYGRQIEPAVARLTAEGAVFGTPSYMSPEQVEGRDVDFRSDLFSFGTVLYEMLTGANPFAADTPLAAAARVLRAEPPEPDASEPPIPASLRPVVRRCLARQPADRYARTADLVADLARVAGDRERDRTARDATPMPDATVITRAWWMFHQAAVMVALALLFVVLRWASGWIAAPWNAALLVAYVIPAVANGILRANLLFNTRVNPAGLPALLRRTRASVVATDMLANALLLAASAALVPGHIMTAVMLAAAGIGNAAVAAWVEPATIEAAFPGVLARKPPA